jgi:very-short-patch-repair endonuclease
VSAEGCHRARADSGAMAPRFDRAIEALARRQHGAFSIHQLHDLGADRYLARRRVAAGRWLRLETGVFALPGNPPTLLRQMKAAELSVPGSAISGTPAAFLHEVPDVRIGRLEISAGRNAGRTSLARVRHRGPVPATTVQGIRVTTLVQTIADIAPSVTAAVLDDAIEVALLRGKATFEQLAAAWERARDGRVPGAPALRDALLRRDPEDVVAASVLEGRLYRLLDDARLPPFVRQAPAPWSPGGRERVDAAFPSVCWIVEGDGRSWHARVGDFERDRERDHRAHELGWGVSRFTFAQIERQGYVVGSLLRTFAARQAI